MRLWCSRELNSQIQVKIASDRSEQDDCSILSLPPIDCEFLYTPNSYFFDSIITLVDAANFSINLFNSEAAQSQITYGDIILLNKTDLATTHGYPNDALANIFRLAQRVNNSRLTKS